MKYLIAFALLAVVIGCDSAPPPAAKEQAAPKVTNGKSASGVQMQEQGH